MKITPRFSIIYYNSRITLLWNKGGENSLTSWVYFKYKIAWKTIYLSTKLAYTNTDKQCLTISLINCKSKLLF